jgi:hypothetical protein
MGEEGESAALGVSSLLLLLLCVEPREDLREERRLEVAGLRPLTLSVPPLSKLTPGRLANGRWRSRRGDGACTLFSSSALALIAFTTFSTYLYLNSVESASGSGFISNVSMYMS